MTRVLLLIAITLVSMIPGSALGVEPARIVLLPFTINAQEDLAYLASEIPAMIGNNLKQEGAAILDPVRLSVEYPDRRTTKDIRKFGVTVAADFVIWGSMTRIGQRFSLDVKMVEPFSEAEPAIVYEEGERIEALPAMVHTVSSRLGLRIFKQSVITEVRIEGNNRIEADAIERVIKAAAGNVYSVKELSQDLKAIYAMGYFDDVRIESEEAPKGKMVIFKVKEKPTVRVIRFKGNRVFDDEKLMENLSISTGSILNIFKLGKNVKRIESLYTEKNYHNIKVTYTLDSLEHEQADLTFHIEEGDKIWIRNITFDGNNAYSDDDLKDLMKTAEKGWFSWITSSGDLSQEDLDRDVDKVTAFYHNNGYIKAKVSEPQVDYRPEGIEISMKIEEGPRFKVGRVDIDGDIILDKAQLLGKLKITEDEFYNRETVRNDLLALADLYSDEGYAYADISPKTEQDPENLVVHITYTIAKGDKVYFERITINGNTITRDKVIRRELKVYEQELYSGVRLKRGVRNLQRLDFFEDVKVNTEKGSAPDQMRLNINVTEKPTGAFSFGGGYSNDEQLFGMASISQRNLFGHGQKLELKAQLGGTTDRFTLSFVEPWFLDMPLSAGVELYNWETDYDDYDKDALGGSVRLSYPVFDYTRASVRYTYEIADIRNVEEDASRSVKELEGENATSSVQMGLKYDSRDKIFNPTEGSEHGITVEYAGLGGDLAFTKYVLETGWYFPLVWDLVGFAHGKTGFVEQNSGGILPDYEKFYLGGINSMRGFEWQGISLYDEDGAEIGAEKMVQFNFELQIPLVKKAGLVGVLFYDTGNVFSKDDTIDLGELRESIGFGFRWYSPIGPIRIENGYILNPRDGEDDNGRWEFSMGSAF